MARILPEGFVAEARDPKGYSAQLSVLATNVAGTLILPYDLRRVDLTIYNNGTGRGQILFSRFAQLTGDAWIIPPGAAWNPDPVIYQALYAWGDAGVDLRVYEAVAVPVGNARRFISV